MSTNFNDIIQNNKPTLVDFHAEWCGPCKMMKPVLEEFKSRVKDDVTILKIDVDKNPKVAGIYQIQGVPTLILFQNGQIKWRQSGVVSAQQLQQIISPFIHS